MGGCIWVRIATLAFRRARKVDLSVFHRLCFVFVLSVLVLSTNRLPSTPACSSPLFSVLCTKCGHVGMPKHFFWLIVRLVPRLQRARWHAHFTNIFLMVFSTLHSTGLYNSTGALARSLSTFSVFSTRLVPSSYLVHVGMHPSSLLQLPSLFSTFALCSSTRTRHVGMPTITLLNALLFLLWTCWDLLCTVRCTFRLLGMGWGSLASLLSCFVVLHVWGRG